MPQLGRFARNYGSILSGLIIGLASLGGAWLISGGVERGLEKKEHIEISVQGFNKPNSTDRLVLAHNYGDKTGTLIAEVVIVASTNDGTRIDRASTSLNPGVAGGRTTNPFTLPIGEGRRYFLTDRPRLLGESATCVLEFQVMQRGGIPRKGVSPSFECNPGTSED